MLIVLPLLPLFQGKDREESRSSAIVPVLIMIVASSSALLTPIHFAFAQSDQTKMADARSYVFLLNPQCNEGFRNNFELNMRLAKTGYEQYIGEEYQIVCAGGISDLRDIERYVVPALRRSTPSDSFLFVYPDAMREQYDEYMADKYGFEYRNAVLGNTDVLQGIAYAKESQSNVMHEMAHLATCATWHDAEGNDLGDLVRHPDSDLLPWCSHDAVK
jgi:hypothetical protein